MTTDSSVIHKYLSGRLTERTWDVSLAISAPNTRWTLADRKGRGVGTNRRTPRVKAIVLMRDCYTCLQADLDRARISQTIPVPVAPDTAFRKPRLNSARQNARIERDMALLRVMTSVMKDDATLFKKSMGEPDFRRLDDRRGVHARLRAENSAEPTNSWPAGTK